MKNLILCALIILSYQAYSSNYNIEKFKIDEKIFDKKYSVNSKSGKKDDIRAYESRKEKVINANIDDILFEVENFEEKCNNEFKEKRKLSDKKKDCLIFNNNIVESKIIKIDLKKFPLDENEIKKYLVLRHIYNRNSYSNYDLIKVFKTKDQDGKTNYTLKQIMLTDKEVKKYISSPTKRDSVFKEAYGEYNLKEISKNKTLMKYTYFTETDHWLLNKSVSVSRVFEGTAKGLNTLFKGIESELKRKNPKN